MITLIIIPGLGDDARYTKFLMRSWEIKYGIRPQVITFGWKGSKTDFAAKYKKMNEKVDEIVKKAEDVSILGISAGASAALNIFYQRPDKIRHMISVCGRLRDPNIGKMWNHKESDLGVFEESIKLCEQNLEKLNKNDKKRILTVRPFFDDIVPVRTMTIDGAVNKRINAFQHMISINLAMTLYSKTIADIIKS